ncbi:hypothetical protein [Burkholderia stagnalis]|uniref:hypothetical protein n=1 Tax=Burkholderia stagnalis TaxID=1503054 RepID=UPI000F5A5ADC|nr:hypothetical protein [Burkholderia stagnalis]
MRTTSTALCVCFFLSASATAASSDGPQSVLTLALAKGAASAPLDEHGQYAQAISAIQARTGDHGPVVVLARRVAAFKGQPRCGRVAYIIAQPTSQIAWTDMGGELNICDDGNPPLRMCKAQSGKLVLPDSICSDGSHPVDTPEVAAALSNAISAGGLDPRAAASRVRAAAAAAGASTAGGETR